MMNRRSIVGIVSIAVIGLLILSSIPLNGDGLLREESKVSIENIETLMIEQVAIGPRHPGSNGSVAFGEWLITKISPSWDIQIQNFTYLGVEIRNYFITSVESSNWPKYLIGAHYDSREFADKDADNPDLPVPGANDGASGVAAVLEMMGHIPNEFAESMGFILFDAEDQGNLGAWPWHVGATYFVNQMTESEVNATDFFLLYDMIANDDLKLRYEGFSDDQLNERIWDKAHELGYEAIFLKENTGSIIDDHFPFVKRGIKSVDLIDLTYPEHHTVDDTMENVSAENAAIVVDVVIEWFKDEIWSGTDPNSSSSSSHSLNDTTDTPLLNSSTNNANYSQLNIILLILVISYQFTRKYSR